MTNVDKRLRRVVKRFWATSSKGGKRRGSRHHNQSARRTARRNDWILAKALANELFDNSVPRIPGARIRYDGLLRGHYRTENRWDIVLSIGGVAVAIVRVSTVIKFDSNTEYDRMIGAAIGDASDLWAAYRLGKLGVTRPFLGYFVLLVDRPAVHRSRRVRQSSQRFDQVLETTTFAQMCEQSLRKLQMERLYTATCLTLATNAKPTVVSQPADDLSFKRFVAALQGHVVTFLGGTP